jgi:RNA polymerase sigma factor (sigma-70 family)
MRDDAELLRQYVQAGSEDAFAELVQRHLPVVYSSALRQTDGDVELAKDICQTVFIDLGRKAGSLLGHELLIGWLFSATRFAAATVLRANRRRQIRERIAFSMHEDAATPALECRDPKLASALDAAMEELTSEDRSAVLLRFFQGKDFKDVGGALGITEDAARMRVTRAIGKLHSLLESRGVTVSAAALGSILATEAVTAVPAGLAATISAAAFAGIPLATTATATGAATKAIAMTTLQKILVAVTVVAASVTTPLVIQHRSQSLLRAENQSLRSQIAQLQQSATEIAVAPPAATKNSARPLTSEQFNELLRLRGEVTRLRRDPQELARLKAGQAQTAGESGDAELDAVLARVNKLKQMLNQKPELKIPELQFLTPQDWLNVAAAARLDTDNGARQALSRLRSAAKLAFSPILQGALFQYVQASGGQLPTEISQLKPFFQPPVDDALLDRYQLLRTGNARDLPASESPIIAESVGGKDRTAIKFRPPSAEGSVISEKAKVDADYDSVMSIGLNGSHLSEQGPPGSALDLLSRSTILSHRVIHTNTNN